MSRLEDRLRDALHAGTDDVEPAPDLFARVQRSVEEDRRRRRFRTRVALGAAAALAALAAFVLLTTDYQDGELHMDWWIFEVIVTVVLVAIAIILGPFIKRFGKTYAAEVFRSNPATGKSFIVLTDVAYYLIFTAYILFTTKFDPPTDWESTVTAPQVQYGLARVGGILLIIGVLHGVNLLILPIIGRLLTLNRRLDQQMREAAARDRQGDVTEM
jgi:hypothetical protein